MVHFGEQRAPTMFKAVPIRLPLLILLLVIGCHNGLAATECPRPATLIAPDDPAYVDAVHLRGVLQSHGFTVECIFPTKFSSTFLKWENGVARSTVEGEACFRTREGDIGVVFVPKPQTFADLKIRERRQGRGYLYSFSGMPGIWLVKNVGSARRQYHIKHDNYILSVDDESVRNRLEEAVADVH
jgi:hypothetical protein